ncbi:MAG: 2-oxo-4-hydroxy-4-carboxy-5-ureidoimidazoline decarboxylase [Alphaproteobacteria bacterium]
MDQKFLRPPTGLAEAEFIARFGKVYEHSVWIAQAVWDGGLTPAHDTVAGMARAMADVLASASQAQKLTLIRAHPDLAGKAALAGALTKASRGEQAGAGLDRCSAAELARFHHLNQAYKDRFGFPFIFAVRGADRWAILAAFEARLAHDQPTEFATALSQINRIAQFRLEDLV